MQSEKIGLDDHLAAGGKIDDIERVDIDDPAIAVKSREAVIMEKLKTEKDTLVRQELFLELCKTAARLSEARCSIIRDCIKSFKFSVKSFDEAVKEELKKIAAEKFNETQKIEEEKSAKEYARLMAVEVTLAQIQEQLSLVCSSPHAYGGVKILMAIALALMLCDECIMLWLFFVSAPSSAKTLIVELLRDFKGTHFLDTMTENALVSGYVSDDPNSANQDLLPLLNGKIFIIKDLSTLFSLAHDTVKKILGDFTSIYDGHFAKHTGTRGGVDYESKFNFVACITPAALYSHIKYMSIIGPRVLYYRMPELTKEEQAAGFLLNDDPKTLANKKVLADLVKAFILQTRDTAKRFPAFSDAANEQIGQLSQFLIRGRALIEMEKIHKMSQDKQTTYLDYEIGLIQKEEPFRVRQQLKVLAQFIALTEGKEKVEPMDLQLIANIVLSSMPVERSQVLQALITVDESRQMTRKELGDITGRSYSMIRKTLMELEAVGLIVQDKVEGENLVVVSLAEEFIQPIKGILEADPCPF